MAARWPGTSMFNSRRWSGPSRRFGRILACADNEYRWKPSDGSGVLQGLLRVVDQSMPRLRILPGGIPDAESLAQHNGELQAHGAHYRQSLLCFGERRGPERQCRLELAARERHRGDGGGCDATYRHHHVARLEPELQYG